MINKPRLNLRMNQVTSTPKDPISPPEECILRAWCPASGKTWGRTRPATRGRVQLRGCTLWPRKGLTPLLWPNMSSKPLGQVLSVVKRGKGTFVLMYDFFTFFRWFSFFGFVFCEERLLWYWCWLWRRLIRIDSCLLGCFRFLVESNMSFYCLDFV